MSEYYHDRILMIVASAIFECTILDATIYDSMIFYVLLVDDRWVEDTCVHDLNCTIIKANIEINDHFEY